MRPGDMSRAIRDKSAKMDNWIMRENPHGPSPDRVKRLLDKKRIKKLKKKMK